MRILAGGVAGIVIAIIAFLAASFLGAVVPRTPIAFSGTGASERIYLVANWLHADLAIPADDEIRERFAFLGTQAGMPIADYRLKYLVFGWGSRAFYTSAPTYAAIRPGPTLRAMTGDQPVIHVVPAGEISTLQSAHPIDLPPGGLARLLDYIEAGFEHGDQTPLHLANSGYGYGDEFFLATGHFNLFNPCNVWIARGLRQAGLATGAWTPTTMSLLLGIRLHSGQALDGRR